MNRKHILVAIALLLCVHYAIGQSIDVTARYNNALEAHDKGDIATAIYELEMAKLAAPHSKAVRHNLNLMKAEVPVDIVEIEPFFLQRWYSGLAGWLSPGVWKYSSILLLILLAVMLYRKLVQQKESTFTSKWVLGGVVGLFMVSVVLGLHRQELLHEGSFAIIMQPAEQLKEGPDTVSDDVKAVSPGVKLEILDSYEDWYKVAAMDREQGWIKQSAVRRIMVTAAAEQ